MSNFRKRMKKTFAMVLAVTMMITLLPQNSFTVFAEETVKTAEEALLPTEAATETPTEEATEVPTEEATETPTEEATEAPTEGAAETPTEGAAETPTEEAAEAPTEAATEVPTEIPTEAATEVPTEAPMETAAQAPEETPMETPLKTPMTVLGLESSDEEMQVAYVDCSDGVYQEGAFSVLGEPEYFDSDVELVGIVNREEAEEYFYQALRAKKTDIDVSEYNISTSEVKAFVCGIINDHPDLYYARTHFSYSYYGSTVFSITVDFYDDCNDEAFNIAVEDAMSEIDDSMTELEKAITLHDYIVLNCEYDNDKSPISHSAYGVFVERTAVCQGYALAYKLLLNKAGIECYMVTSDSMNHAWNLVCLDGEYYQVDTTWDDPILDSIGLAMHKYMFVSDEAFQSTAAERTEHSNWKITKGSEEISLTAKDDRYDNAFWVNGYSPLLIEDGSCYYIKTDKGNYTNTIQKRDLSTGVETVILENGYLENWWNYLAAYSGLVEINGNLYFNSSDKIFRVSKEGGVPVAMTDKLSTDNALVCGIVLQGGKIKYSLKTQFPYREKGSVNIADLKEQVSLEINKITITPEKMTLKKGDSKLLTAEALPSYVEKPAFTWTTSDSKTATVTDGLVTAVGEGKCIITASAGDKSASCEVIVKNKLTVPVFSHEGGYIDKNSAVSITSADGAEIYYTIDGSTPSVANTATTKKYTAPIVIDKDMTIKAIAVSDSVEIEDSDVAEASFIACTNELVLGKTETTLTEGEKETITVTQLPTANTMEDVTWTSSDPAVATVEKTTGEITAIFEGEADITASVTNYKNEVITATCHVKVNAPYYTVTFCDWNDKVLSKVKVKARTAATAPIVELPKGYDLAGWDKRYSCIVEDITIKAVLKLSEYKITYELSGGKNAEDNPSVYTIKDNITLLPAYGKEGYKFIGWYKEPELKTAVTTIQAGSTGDIILYAGWTRQLNMPEFSVPGGTVDKGTKVAITAEEGFAIYYTLNGSEPGTTVNTTTKKYSEPIIIDKDMTIKAIAVGGSKEYENSEVASVSYKACTSNLILESNEIELTEGETAAIGIKELPTTREESDVTFTISKTEPDMDTEADKNRSVITLDQHTGKITAEFSGTAVITASVEDHKGETVKAECKVTVKRPVYTVTFVYPAGIGEISQQVEARRKAAVPEMTLPEGYEFTDWRVDDKPIDVANIVVVKDTTIIMNYELTKYRIIYHTNGGNEKAQDTYTVETDNLVLGEATGKEGFRFDGWYRNEQLTGDRVYEIAKGSTGDIELFAAWKDERGLWMQAEGSSNPDEIPAQNYTGKAIKPGFVIYFGAKELKAGKDYTVSYKNNKAANLLETDAEKSKAPTVIIKGKGNYAGTLTKTFQILKKNIEDGEGEGSDKVYEIRIDDLAAAYKNGKAIWPVPTVIWNGKKLANKKDFTVTYPDIQDDENAYKEPGIYSVQIDGCGNYEGTRTIQFTITNPKTEKLISKVKIAKIPNQTYTGSLISPTEDILKLTDGAYELKLTEDYTVKYAEGDDGTNVGTHSLIITGKGKYAGVKRITFKVTGTAISTAVIGNLPKLTYTGEALEFDPEAEKDAENKLVITDREGNPLKDEDYTLSFSNNVNVGTAKMVVKGTGKYSGSITKTFKIVPDTLANAKVQVTFANGSEKQSYEKGGAKPEIIVTYRVKDETVTLKEGVDYTVSYKNNTSADEKEDKLPTVTIKGKKNFNGSRTMTFSIEKKDIKNVNIMAPDLEENTKAGKYMSVPVLTDENGKKLKAGTDYKKTYKYSDAGGTLLDRSSTPKAGSSITVTVEGTGNYEGTASCTFRIVEKGKLLSKSKITVKNKIYYNGGIVTLTKDDLKVMLGGVELDENSYTITGYSKNDRKGTARVTIQGTGDYGGTKTKSFKILSHSMKWWESLHI